MVINKTGKIIEDLYPLGRPATPGIVLATLYPKNEYCFPPRPPANPIRPVILFRNVCQTMMNISNPGPKQPESAYLLNLEARIKAVHKHMDHIQLNGHA